MTAVDGDRTVGDVMHELRVMAYLESCALRNGLDIPPDVSPCVKSVVMPISCPTCGSCMEFVTNSAPATMRVTAMFLCPKCHVHWQFIGGLERAFREPTPTVPQRKAEDIECGTEPGYQLHRRRRKAGLPGGVSCDECKLAHRIYERSRRALVISA